MHSFRHCRLHKAALVAAMGVLSVVTIPCRTTHAQAGGQQFTMMADASLMEIPVSRIQVVGGRGLRGAQKFLVPTAILHLSIDGTFKSSSVTLRSSASVQSSYRVTGLTTATVSLLAAQSQSELRQRLTAAGATVFSYEDVSGNPLMSAVARQLIDSSYRAPIVRVNASRTTYAVAAPSAAQLFAGNALRKHLAFRELAKETGAVVLIPELWFSAPQHERVAGGRPDAITASMSVTTGMDMVNAGLSFVTPAGAVGTITMSGTLAGVSPNVGNLAQVVQDSTHTGNTVGASALAALSAAGVIGLASARTPGGNAVWQTTFDFEVAEDAYAAAVARGAASFLRAATLAIIAAMRP